MKTIDGVCKELKTLDGVVGAFVLKRSECLGSSLPPQYDSSRLVQVAGTIARVGQISHRAGYDGISTAFHWQRASLMTWPLEDDALLGLIATPTAVREAIELSASIALEDLSSIVSGKPRTIPCGPPASAKQKPPAPDEAKAELDSRLQDIERLLIEELGPAGKHLLERCRNRTPRGGEPASEWLLSLRSAILGDVTDPGARVTIGTSVYWAELG
jgi:hypothetical protein